MRYPQANPRWPMHLIGEYSPMIQIRYSKTKKPSPLVLSSRVVLTVQAVR